MNGLQKQVNDFERELIIAVLNQNNGKVEAAAMVFKMPSSSLYRKMKKMGIKIEGVAK